VTSLRNGALVLLLATIVAACSNPGTCRSPSGSGPTGNQSSATGPKRIVTGILGNPYTLSQEINTAGTGSIRGVGETEKLIHAGLVIRDGDGNLRPQLAEAVPTIENGNWRLLPEGRMETTWKLKDAAVWHDGKPVTADDLVFTLGVGRDRDLALPGYDPFGPEGANANLLIPDDARDPISGSVPHRTQMCRVRRLA